MTPLYRFRSKATGVLKRPLKFLDGYHGYVHADAYPATGRDYDELFRKKEVIEVGCWVHARRKFDEAVSSRPKEATEIMARVAQLYRLESECNEMEPEDRCRVRQQRARPIIERTAPRSVAAPVQE